VKILFGEILSTLVFLERRSSAAAAAKSGFSSECVREYILNDKREEKFECRSVLGGLASRSIRNF
jgi:hypothetical protein